MRVGDLEFFRNTEGRYPEICAWNGNSRYTLLWYKKDKEGWYIEFVGDRPLRYDGESDIMKMMRYGQTVLDAEYQLIGEY